MVPRLERGTYLVVTPSLGAHLLALVCAAAAGLGALLAMRHCVRATFFGAGAAQLGAQPAKVGGMSAGARHQSSSRPADLGAINVQRDTAGHGFYVLFLETGGGADVAGVGAGVAGIDAALKIILVHGSSFSFRSLVVHCESHVQCGRYGTCRPSAGR